MVRDNILLRGLPVPKKFQLPNGRLFFVKYERFPHGNLQRSVMIKRKRAIGPRNRHKQRGKEMIGNLFKTGVNISSHFLSSAIG